MGGVTMNRSDEVDVTFAGAGASRPAWIEEITDDGWITVAFNDMRGEWTATAYRSWFTLGNDGRWKLSL